MRKSHGFTLLELLLVVTIIGIFGMTATVFYGRFMLQSAVDTTSDQFAGSLRKAQMYSMMGKYKGANTTWGVHYGSDTITLFLGTSYATRDQSVDETFIINPRVAVTGFSEVIFAKRTGLPSQTATITITGGNSVRSMTINSLGVVSR